MAATKLAQTEKKLYKEAFPKLLFLEIEAAILNNRSISISDGDACFGLYYPGNTPGSWL
jgi:hypothetical protein